MNRRFFVRMTYSEMKEMDRLEKERKEALRQEIIDGYNPPKPKGIYHEDGDWWETPLRNEET